VKGGLRAKDGRKAAKDAHAAAAGGLSNATWLMANR
jgi:hypothetical protein